MTIERVVAVSFLYSSNQGGSEEHISLITVMFSFNEFAFTVQVEHKINSVDKFLALHVF